MVDNRYCFVTEWYDPQACFIRQYQLLFYPIDNSIELFEVKTKKHFLKRSKYEELQLRDLYVGNTITVLSRTMKVTSYGDEYTQRSLEKNQEKTLGVLLNGHFSKLGQIIDNIYKSNIKIAKIKRVSLSVQEVAEILKDQKYKPSYNPLLNAISSDPVVLIELVGIDCENVWKNTVGVGDLVFELESNALKNLHDGILSDNNSHLGRNSAVYNSSTCCLIKPHIISAGMLGAVIYEIQKAGFEISAILSVNFNKPNAEEFLEVYKGVVQEYPQLVDEFLSGMSVALEVRAENAQAVFREFCGPHDPEIARALRPKTLRASFGTDRVRNAVHCTDLPEDALLEVEYFFRILDH